MKTYLLRSLLVAAASGLVLTSSYVHAGSATGKVLSIVTTPNGLFGFSVGVVNTRPACATSNEWAINPMSTTGKAMIAQVLSAQANGLTLEVHGGHACDVWSDRETAIGIYSRP